jgi:hypothetical protein
MITKLSIDRFKSMRSLSISCRKVNVFIGAPDTGKTNILEALYFLSRLGWSLPIDNSLRLRQELGFDTLFFRQFFDHPFQILLDLGSPRPRVRGMELRVEATVTGQERSLAVTVLPAGHNLNLRFGQVAHISELDWIRFYSYMSSEAWQYNSGWLHGQQVPTVPHGSNLIYIARHNQKVYDFLKEIVSALNWKLRFDQSQKTFRLSEVRADEILDYNLDLLSDSLKRLFFYGAILLTSQDTALVLDEPDVFAFPPYPKTLGEMIAEDESNQFFLTTHNPYFLAGIIGKTPVEKLALFVCYRDSEGATAVKALTADNVATVIEQGANVFFNLDQFLSQ